jgi:hypothetical protein
MSTQMAAWLLAGAAVTSSWRKVMTIWAFIKSEGQAQTEYFRYSGCLS